MMSGLLSALLRACACIVSIALYSTSANAIAIVDTGASPFIGSADPGISVFGSTLGLGSQFVAGRFTTTADFEITGLSAFVRNYSCCNPITEKFHIGIASGPSIPSNSAFTTLVSAQATFLAASGQAGWADVNIGNYFLSAGTYWIVASVLSGDSSIGLGMPGGVPKPLDAYAFFSSSLGGWNPLTGGLGGSVIPAAFGFRVTGTAVAIPEVGTLALFVLGFFVFLRRRIVRR